MRIGIMGGTFDPIHNGHLMLGEYAYQQFHLDEVWYMPNGNPPHKSNPEIRKDLQDRAEMTRLAIEEIPYFRLCTYEMIERKLRTPIRQWSILKRLIRRMNFILSSVRILFSIWKPGNVRKDF